MTMSEPRATTLGCSKPLHWELETMSETHSKLNPRTVFIKWNDCVYEMKIVVPFSLHPSSALSFQQHALPWTALTKREPLPSPLNRTPLLYNHQGQTHCLEAYEIVTWNITKRQETPHPLLEPLLTHVILLGIYPIPSFSSSCIESWWALPFLLL